MTPWGGGCHAYDLPKLFEDINMSAKGHVYDLPPHYPCRAGKISVDHKQRPLLPKKAAGHTHAPLFWRLFCWLIWMKDGKTPPTLQPPRPKERKALEKKTNKTRSTQHNSKSKPRKMFPTSFSCFLLFAALIPLFLSCLLFLLRSFFLSFTSSITSC